MAGKVEFHNDGSVTIDAERWKEISEELFWLDCLKLAGVDNWEGISVAYDISDDAGTN